MPEPREKSVARRREERRILAFFDPRATRPRFAATGEVAGAWERGQRAAGLRATFIP